MVSIRKEVQRHEKKKAKENLKLALQRRKEKKVRRKAELKLQMEKAGLDAKPSTISRIVIILTIIVNMAITLIAVNRWYDVLKDNYLFITVMVLVVWVMGTALVMFILWLLFYVSLDVAIFNRKKKLEEVLPDFLQLTSSNVRAGMTIDQALWFAIRPRFGVLANEIEQVEKRTYAGESLELALQTLVKKYDSKTLERAMNLLIEGIRSGGEVGDLLNKIAENIQETNLMKKEMAANVTTYVIFISFATIVAAPFLFALAYNLVAVIQDVFSRVNISPAATASMPLTISTGVIAISDFKIFAIVSLLITSFFSAIIISTIKKGSIKEGIKYIPAFMIASIIIFLIMEKMFSIFVSGFF